eukprot:c6498_g1_i1.p1 GENE.c6498_g1_i1~~c6498_g1_i1.p1  ORF type:complete len:277 (-),score=88.23 c6498_g1_i1:54-884(-)
MSTPTFVVNVTNISPSGTLPQLIDFFSHCGTVVDLGLTKDESRTDGFQQALVVFDSHDAAVTAELLSGAIFANEPLTITRTQSAGATEVAREEGAPPTDGEWKSVSSLGAMVGKGFLIGQKAVDFLVEFNERNKITSTVSTTAHNLDERTHLSASVTGLVAKAKAKWSELDERHGLRVKGEGVVASGKDVLKSTNEKFQVTSRLESAKKAISEKAAQNETVTKGLSALRSTASAFVLHAQNAVDAHRATSPSSPTAADTAPADVPTTTATEMSSSK